MKNKPGRVYLAGPINGMSDAESCEWRNQVIQVLGRSRVIDPMQWDFRGLEGVHYAEIVEKDKAAIDECDVLLANVWRVTAGTMMEILYAWERGKRVVAVVRDAPSPWIRYHAEVFQTLDAAVEAIR